MKPLRLQDDNSLSLYTTLTQYQISKFNALYDKLIITPAGQPLVPVDELHGVLLTNSRKSAQAILSNYIDIIKNYIVHTDEYRGINPIGLYAVLQKLSLANPRRSKAYYDSAAVLAYIIARHPQILIHSNIAAIHKSAEQTALVRKLKKRYTICQLSGLPFYDGEEKHVHHIKGQSENPSLAAEESNLVVLKGHIHMDYHSWLSKQGLDICPGTLKYYAMQNGYKVTAFGKIESKSSHQDQ